MNDVINKKKYNELLIKKPIIKKCFEEEKLLKQVDKLSSDRK